MILTRQASLAVLAEALAAAMLPRAVRAASGPTIRVGVIPSDFAAQVYYAKEKGFFSNVGVNAELIPVNSGAAAASAVVSGSLDFAYSNCLSLAVAHDKGLPFVAVAVANIYRSDAPAGGLIGVKQSSDIHTAKDLNGKTMAVGALGSIVHLGARAWLDANGGDSTTLHYADMPISTMGPAVISGRVDAAVMDLGVYPTLGKAGDPIRVVGHAYDAVAPTFAIGAWFTTKDWVTKRPADVRSFVSACTQSANWANAHHHESAAILAKSIGVSAEQIDAGVRYIYGTDLTPQLLQPSIDVAAKYGAIRAGFPARDLGATLT